MTLMLRCFFRRELSRALFLVFMPLYGLMRSRVLRMSAFVVAFSLFFYYKCSGWFALLLVSTSLIDWLLSQAMATEGATRAFRQRVRCVVVVGFA